MNSDCVKRRSACEDAGCAKEWAFSAWTTTMAEYVDEDGEWPPEHTFRFIMTACNHLGFKERDPIRGMDTFRTFEEILRLAVYYDVDFVLQGGDLFDRSRPSRECLSHAMKALSHYCLGDRAVSFEVRGSS